MSHRTKGFIYLGVAFLLHALNATFAHSVAEISPAQRTYFESVVAFLFIDIGINAVIIVLVCIGGFYLVVGDIVENFLSSRIVGSFDQIRTSVDQGFDSISNRIFQGVVKLGKDLVIAWINRRDGSPQEYAEISAEAAAAFYGDHVKDDTGYMAYTREMLLDKSLNRRSVNRTNVNIKASLRTQESIPHLNVWEENKHFDLVTLAPPVKYPLLSKSRFPIHAQNVRAAIERCFHYIEIDSKRIIDFDSIKDELLSHRIESTNFKRDDISVAYNGSHLQITLSKEIELTKNTTSVYIYEKALMSEGDSLYSMTAKEPTRGFDFQIDLPSLYRFESFVVGAQHYHAHCAGNATLRGWPAHDHFAGVHIDRWVLPGLVLVIHWERKAVESVPVGQS
jgi:hypothetical protein